jgi:tripeptidyl-peptidase-1
MGWISFNATVEEAESLLRTKYGIYTNIDTGNDYLDCEDYSDPTHIKQHIDFITPTVHFDATVTQKEKRRDLQKREMSVKPVPQAQPNPEAEVPQPEISFTLANCYQYITPDCLRSLYNFTNESLAL